MSENQNLSPGAEQLPATQSPRRPPQRLLRGSPASVLPWRRNRCWGRIGPTIQQVGPITGLPCNRIFWMLFNWESNRIICLLCQQRRGKHSQHHLRRQNRWRWWFWHSMLISMIKSDTKRWGWTAVWGRPQVWLNWDRRSSCTQPNSNPPTMSASASCHIRWEKKQAKEDFCPYVGFWANKVNYLYFIFMDISSHLKTDKQCTIYIQYVYIVL